LFLHAQTGLHPGSGTALGVVDLPVQRERHTRWPVIPGSALKGILRDFCRERAKVNHGGDRRLTNEKDESLIIAFGPGKIGEDTAHAGAISITDARILAFPVRSLKGVFAWVTCPDVLDRLNRDLKIAGMPIISEAVIPRPKKSDQEEPAFCPSGSPLLLDGKQVVLEEFDFVVKGSCDEAAKWIAKHAVTDASTRDRISKHLVVLHNDDFSHFVQHATEVAARIGLNYDRKSVATGALFYQEFLPPETLFYSLVLANDGRSEKQQSAAETMAYLADHLPPDTVLQVGGDETIGKGLCLVRLSNGKEG
jgi:CRISPR-associated protein Cmr4